MDHSFKKRIHFKKSLALVMSFSKIERKSVFLIWKLSAIEIEKFST